MLDAAILRRMKNLLATFVGAVLYFTVVYHMTNLYFAKQTDFERFILLDGGMFTTLFWVGQILMGTIPMSILLHPARIRTVLVASAMIILGGFFQLYVFIIGGQAFPLNLFPGMEQQQLLRWQDTSLQPQPARVSPRHGGHRGRGADNRNCGQSAAFHAG